MIPVYMIQGFLDSGKTDFITYTLQAPYFQISGRTLLLVCEEGELEYDQSVLEATHTVMEVIEHEEDFNPAYLLELEKKYKPERIVVEYNGMWNVKNRKLPFHWNVEQQITNIDASSFALYFTNMKSHVSDMIRKSDMIIFNRCDGIEELPSYRRNALALNQKAEIIMEDSNGEVNEIWEEDLPYDSNADCIKLNDDSYGIWFLDCSEHPERYEGKQVEFIAQVFRPKDFPDGYFVPGRTAMTCCADDMAFLGYVCVYEQAGGLADKEWVVVKAVVAFEYSAAYEEEGPVLYADLVTKTKKPKEEVISFA